MRSDLALDQGAVIEGTEDEKLLAGLNLPAARMTFYKVEDSDELRRIIDSGDFGAWRIFLHPQQREYAEKSRNDCGVGDRRGVVAADRTREDGGDGDDEDVRCGLAEDGDGDRDQDAERSPARAGGKGKSCRNKVICLISD